LVEKLYHMLDLKRSLLFARGENPILVVEFRYAEGHEHPIVFVTDGKVDSSSEDHDCTREKDFQGQTESGFLKSNQPSDEH
jgi:hypothetical protein